MRELIYKDEAYKAIDNCICDSWYRISPSDAKMNIHHLVSDANEADRPQGKWIEDYNGNGWNDYWDYTCSNCGKKYERADAVLYKANVCPNCGADMRGGGE